MPLYFGLYLTFLLHFQVELKKQIECKKTHSAKSMSTKRPVFTIDSLIGFNFRAEAFKSKGSSSPILSTVDEKIELIRDFVEFVNRFDVVVERI